MILIVFGLGVGIKCFMDMQEEALTVVTDTKAYQGRKAFFEDKYGEYFSGLLIFPENNYETMNIEKYYYERDLLSLDTCYKIVLEYTLGEEEFQKERQRLSKISIDYKGETHNILHTEKGFRYPVFIGSFDPLRTYEYALIDEKNKKIICVFFQINMLEKSIITEEYMPIYDELPSECNENFNIYYFKSKDLIYGIESYDMWEK